MKELKVREYNLDWIMENYFNTDKEVMLICDYDNAWEILQYSEYAKEDFSDYFSIDLDCEYPYYIVYKYSDETFIIELLTNTKGGLYPEYTADDILIQDCVFDEYGRELLDKCEVDNEITMLKYNDMEDLKSLEENYSNKECQCGCNTCCDECCEDEKEEVFDRIYKQGVIDALKRLAELL